MFDSSIFLRTQTYIDREKFFILFFQQIVACVWGGLCVCVDTKRFNEQINEEMPFAWKENPMRERSASNSLNWKREREREQLQWRVAFQNQSSRARLQPTPFVKILLVKRVVIFLYIVLMNIPFVCCQINKITRVYSLPRLFLFFSFFFSD